jgi:hypothetical protein
MTANTMMAGTKFRSSATMRLSGMTVCKSASTAMGCGGVISTGGVGGGMACASTKIVAKTVTHSSRYTRQLACRRCRARPTAKLPRPTINELRM